MIHSGGKVVQPGKWIMDSGASDHMIANLSSLKNVKKAPFNFNIKLPTGDTTLITHIGDIVLEGGLKMLNVLHVPGFTHNLLSIYKLAKDNGCDVTFHAAICMIVDYMSRKLRGVGKLTNGMYYLVDSTAKEGIKDQLKGQQLICVTCPMKKFSKLPYPQSSSRAKERFDLIHIDTWGPYRTGVKVIRSDNTLEFADGACKRLYASKGIIHQTTCVFNPQQNACAERKHGKFLEIARVLKLQVVFLSCIGENENGTWDIVTLPLDKQAIGSKWVYKTKYNPDGSIERYKSRLVILGYKKVYGIDFTKMFAPVAKLTTVRALLAVAAMQDWIVCQMDVSNAFLNGDLDEVVYMKMQLGHTGMGSRISVSLDS
ncbi:uncharacterized protein LOC141718403 [Apium graveolens]|uniref:uncharacterized protein LOC141718403 n=1 Tax=Apium graveolens TaxID=4045 RepID=UPI003D791D17